MKLAIIKCVNGNFSVVAEGITDDQTARVNFHNQCSILWNAPDVITGEVAIVDEQLNFYRGYKEFINHAVPSEQEAEPDSDESET